MDLLFELYEHINILLSIFFFLVLKSDNANGLFGFTSINPVVIQESSNVSVNIERLKGQFGSATVSWSLYKSSTSSLAVNDFIMASGTVVFDENESEKVYKTNLCLVRFS